MWNLIYPKSANPCVFLRTRKCLDIKCTNCDYCTLKISDVCMKSFFTQVIFILDSIYVSSQICSALLPNLFSAIVISAPKNNLVFGGNKENCYTDWYLSLQFHLWI